MSTPVVSVHSLKSFIYDKLAVGEDDIQMITRPSRMVHKRKTIAIVNEHGASFTAGILDFLDGMDFTTAQQELDIWMG